VVMLDRRKLAATLFALAAAFVAVLIIGGFTGHASATSGSTQQATPRPPATTGAGPAASTGTSPAATRGPAIKLTVRAVARGSAASTVVGSKVNVLQNGTLTSVAEGHLNSALEWAANVPAGQYQVCINPPGWASAVRNTQPLGPWICSAADVRAAPQRVTFRLTLQFPQAAGQ